MAGDRDVARTKNRRIALGFFFIDMALRLFAGPALKSVDPSVSRFSALVFLIPAFLLGWFFMHRAMIPIREWWVEEDPSPFKVARAIASVRGAALRVTLIYSASWLVPYVLTVSLLAEWNLVLAMFGGASVFGPLPFAYSFATRIVSLATPFIEADARRHGLEFRLSRSTIRIRMLVTGLSIAMYPTFTLGSLALRYHMHGTHDLVLLPVSLGWIVVFAFVCASMVASDFTDAHASLALATRSLEDRVVERTQSLAAMNEKLQAEMQSRLDIELELRQANELEAVGRLAAGIAHEINSPVQYAKDSLSFLQNANEDLHRLLGAYQELQALARTSADATMIAAAAQLSTLEIECDAHYVLGEIPLAISRGLEGLARVTKIVRSMNQFAYADGAEMATVELNEAISSTLAICNNEIKYVADLEMKLGELPPVPCFVGEINQAVLNLVVNAAHAISDQVKGTDRRGKIAISTRAENDAVVISIADTGGGIPASIRDRIFDPFFTTKEVGRGTGQGLAIARAVAQKHRGHLEFETDEGVGTTFHLRLPLAA